MAFDPGTSCVTESVFQLPACLQGDPDTLKLHAGLLKVTLWLGDHWIPKDPYDVPYLYRTNYLPDYVTANDVAALGRITAQAQMRGVDVPVVLGPMLPTAPNQEVSSEDVIYAAANAGPIADALDPLLAAMIAATPPTVTINWWLIGGILGGAALLGLAVAGSYNEAKKEGGGARAA